MRFIQRASIVMASGLSLAALASIPAAAASAAQTAPPPGRATAHLVGPGTRLGLAGASAAQAANGKLFSKFAAGYVAGGGRFFRFASTTLTVPAPNTNDPTSEAVVGLDGAKQFGELLILPGGGAGSVGYDWANGSANGSGVINLAPKAGDQVTISAFYNQQGVDSFTVADSTMGTSIIVMVKVGTSTYTGAEVLGFTDNTKVTAPTADTQLWAFTSSHLTTYTGARGTLLGPWATAEVVDTLTGAPSGALVIDSPVLWNSGQNFGVWLRTTA